MATKVWATITPAGGERQREAEPPVEVLADQAAAAERVEERDAGDDRRQHHRQRAERRTSAPPRERRRGPAARRAARRTGSRATVAHERALQRQPQRGERAVRREDRPDVSPRRLPQQPEERQREEGDGDDGEDEGRRPGGVPRPTRAADGRLGRTGAVTVMAAEAVLGQDRLAVRAEDEVDERLVDVRRSSTP